MDELASTTEGSGEERITPENGEDAKNKSTNKNGWEQMPPNKNQVFRRKAPEESHTEVCTFEKPKVLSRWKGRTTKSPIRIGLMTSRRCPINCVFDIAAPTILLQEDLVEPHYLLLIRNYDSPQLEIATNQKVEVVEIILLQV